MGPSLVTLLDGRVVFSDAREWAHLTEARQLLNYSPYGREDMLAGILKQRGQAAVDALKATMAELAGKGTT